MATWSVIFKTWDRHYSGDPITIENKGKPQCKDTGPPDQVKVIHGERYMQIMSTASSYVGRILLTGCTIYEINIFPP